MDGVKVPVEVHIDTGIENEGDYNRLNVYKGDITAGWIPEKSEPDINQFGAKGFEERETPSMLDVKMHIDQEYLEELPPWVRV